MIPMFIVKNDIYFLKTFVKLKNLINKQVVSKCVRLRHNKKITNLKF